MRTQATSQSGTSSLRLLHEKLLHSLDVSKCDGSTPNYPRFNYLRPSAIQLCRVT
jgi:hypothetical protein